MSTADDATPDEPLAAACSRVLAYLADANARNPRAEVSSQELQHELGLPEEVVRRCIEYLVREGLAEADLFPRNTWVRHAGVGGSEPPPFGP